MKKVLLIAMSLTVISACAQGRIKGNGQLATKTVTTEDYEKVSVAGFFDVNLVSGNEGKITVEGESNLIEHLKIESVGGVLKIATQPGKKLSTTHGMGIKITVPFESISGVSLSGSGDVKGKSTIKAGTFETALTGSGDLTLDVEADTVEAAVTGSGDLVLKGKADTLRCDVTGSGDLNAYGLQSVKVQSQVTGSGDCKVFCTGELEGRVSGSGDIHYKGDPKKTDNKVSGSGSISKA